ncbi:hypothetical protein [Runella slithyformis]|uniref:Uncharacterized protein n=1 Tax=Runella slithyformis (strain ATCC 29530 / DSM 19594 / LMG 11500 / NCIMB 11436 / LSU 4) TaxID=761193 RepID=A0A7U3ZGF3_RUNSL|nr:hypothetical protein [Runella slithyformis]AEI46761.1 hypothetical protein Runsl_0309 [Runella slithyformis DSM 19594]
MRTWFTSPLKKDTQVLMDVFKAPRLDGVSRTEITELGFLAKNELGTWDAFQKVKGESIHLGVRYELWEAQRLLMHAILQQEEDNLRKSFAS